MQYDYIRILTVQHDDKFLLNLSRSPSGICPQLHWPHPRIEGKNSGGSPHSEWWTSRFSWNVSPKFQGNSFPLDSISIQSPNIHMKLANITRYVAGISSSVSQLPASLSTSCHPRWVGTCWRWVKYSAAIQDSYEKGFMFRLYLMICLLNNHDFPVRCFKWPEGIGYLLQNLNEWDWMIQMDQIESRVVVPVLLGHPAIITWLVVWNICYFSTYWE